MPILKDIVTLGKKTLYSALPIVGEKSLFNGGYSKTIYHSDLTSKMKFPSNARFNGITTVGASDTEGVIIDGKTYIFNNNGVVSQPKANEDIGYGLADIIPFEAETKFANIQAKNLQELENQIKNPFKEFKNHSLSAQWSGEAQAIKMHSLDNNFAVAPSLFELFNSAVNFWIIVDKEAKNGIYNINNQEGQKQIEKFKTLMENDPAFLFNPSDRDKIFVLNQEPTISAITLASGSYESGGEKDGKHWHSHGIVEAEIDGKKLILGGHLDSVFDLKKASLEVQKIEKEMCLGEDGNFHTSYGPHNIGKKIIADAFKNAGKELPDDEILIEIARRDIAKEDFQTVKKPSAEYPLPIITSFIHDDKKREARMDELVEEFSQKMKDNDLQLPVKPSSVTSPLHSESMTIPQDRTI